MKISDSGCGRGMRRGGGFGFGRGSSGFRQGRGLGFRGGPGRDPGLSGPSFLGEGDLDLLKRYRDHLDLRKKDIEAELKSVDEKIASLGK
jgi:hypothetical protein